MARVVVSSVRRHDNQVRVTLLRGDGEWLLRYHPHEGAARYTRTADARKAASWLDTMDRAVARGEADQDERGEADQDERDEKAVEELT